MKLQVVRTQFGKDATNGMLFIDGVFECFTLEDQEQAVKVKSETAIPLGSYNVVLRAEGGFNKNTQLSMVIPGIRECCGYKTCQNFNGS